MKKLGYAVLFLSCLAITSYASKPVLYFLPAHNPSFTGTMNGVNLSLTEGVYASTGSFIILKTTGTTGAGTVLGFGTNCPSASITPDMWLEIYHKETNQSYYVPAFKK